MYSTFWPLLHTVAECHLGGSLWIQRVTGNCLGCSWKFNPNFESVCFKLRSVYPASVVSEGIHHVPHSLRQLRGAKALPWTCTAHGSMHYAKAWHCICESDFFQVSLRLLSCPQSHFQCSTQSCASML